MLDLNFTFINFIYKEEKETLAKQVCRKIFRNYIYTLPAVELQCFTNNIAL